jgi:segregation and condensation protein A
MQYVELMDAMRFELAAEYLLMAAMLAEIKSRMLLPRATTVEEDEEDPRAQLIRRLQEYERFKKAAEEIEELPRLERDTWVATAAPPPIEKKSARPGCRHARTAHRAVRGAQARADVREPPRAARGAVDARAHVARSSRSLQGQQFLPFVSLFNAREGKLGVVVTFLAIMELIKESLVEIVQTENFGPIHVKARSE